jgi:tRNA (cytosine34-C5)-methyltransferase
LPHQQNTGGFFVAVVKKTGPLPWENAAKAAGVVEEKVEEKTEEPKEEPKVVGEKESGRRSPLRKKRRANVFKEDPFIFFDQNEPTWPEIR